MSALSSELKKQKGQGLLEYIIISGLIGIFCLGAVKLYGKAIQSRVQDMKKKVNQELRIN